MAKFKVGDWVRESGIGAKISRVLEMPRDINIIKKEYGPDWDIEREKMFRSRKTWYNLDRDGKGSFYADIDLKPYTYDNSLPVSRNSVVANAVAASNAGIVIPFQEIVKIVKPMIGKIDKALELAGKAGNCKELIPKLRSAKNALTAIYSY